MTDRHVTDDGSVYTEGEYDHRATEAERERRRLLERAHSSLSTRYQQLARDVPKFLARLEAYEPVTMEEINQVSIAMGCEFNIAIKFNGRTS